MAHPPGHGLAALVGKAATLLPLGPVALKVGLASAIAGALAAAQTASLGRDLAARVRGAVGWEGASRSDDLLGAAAGLLFAGSYAAAFQAVRPEVYALSALLVISTLRGLERFDATGDRRQLYLASLWAGLALTNHHLLALAAIVPAVAIALGARRREPGTWAAAARVLAGGALGAALIAYLPLRASRHPLVDWGAPLTFARTFWTVSAQAFQKAVATRGSSGDLPLVGAALTVELRFFGALLALAGAYVLIRLPRTRRIACALLVAALADAAMPALVGFDPVNPDAYGYLEAAVALLCVLAVALPVVILARLRDRPPLAVGSGATLTAAAVLALVLGFPRWSLASDWNAQRTFGAFWASAPPRATVVTSYFQTIFASWYLRAAEGVRPDCDLIDRHFLSYPGYRDEIVRKTPSLASFPQVPEPRVIEYDLDLPPAFFRDAQNIAAEPVGETQADRFAAWEAFLSAHRACATGNRAQFAERLAHARAIIGVRSPELDSLAKACQ